MSGKQFMRKREFVLKLGLTPVRKEDTRFLPKHEFGYKVLILSMYMDFKDTLRLVDNVFTVFANVCRLSVCIYTVRNSITGLFLKSLMRDQLS